MGGTLPLGSPQPSYAVPADRCASEYQAASGDTDQPRCTAPPGVTTSNRLGAAASPYASVWHAPETPLAAAHKAAAGAWHSGRSTADEQALASHMDGASCTSR